MLSPGPDTIADRCRRVVGECETTVNPAGKVVTPPPEPLPARPLSRKLSFVRNQVEFCTSCPRRTTAVRVRMRRRAVSMSADKTASAPRGLRPDLVNAYTCLTLIPRLHHLSAGESDFMDRRGAGISVQPGRAASSQSHPNRRKSVILCGGIKTSAANRIVVHEASSDGAE